MTDKRAERSLWELAIENRNNSVKSKAFGTGETDEKIPNQQSEESSIFVMGSKGSGKSTIISRFLDKDETPKPTVALDYTFGRRAKGHNMYGEWQRVSDTYDCDGFVDLYFFPDKLCNKAHWRWLDRKSKDIGHIWELGGGTFLSKLNEVPLTAETIRSTAILLVLDLSKPNELWNTMEVLLKATRTTVDKLLSAMKKGKSSVVEELQGRAWKRFGEDHQDKSFLDPFPIPIGIVGTKYDIYQDFDPEKRKMISRTLRFIAHSNGAHLQYCSSKAEGLVNRTRALFSNLLFHVSTSKASSTDHNKPIIIPAGQDTFSNIGAPPVPAENLAKLTGRRPYDLWKAAYGSVFPPENLNNSQKNEDITNNSHYAEAAIDAMRAQKEEELERYKRQAERRAKTSHHGNQACHDKVK